MVTYDAKQAFAERLNGVLDEHGFAAKGEGRQTAVAAEFGVSQKGARKWLEGEGLPTNARIADICRRFGISRDWLVTGLGPKKPWAASPDDQGGPPEVRDDRGAYAAGATLARLLGAAAEGKLSAEDVAALDRIAKRVS